MAHYRECFTCAEIFVAVGCHVFSFYSGLKYRGAWNQTHLLYLVCLVTQSCLTLCDPMDYSLPCSSVHGPWSNWEKKNNFNHVIRYIDKYRYIDIHRYRLFFAAWGHII